MTWHIFRQWQVIFFSAMQDLYLVLVKGDSFIFTPFIHHLLSRYTRGFHSFHLDSGSSCSNSVDTGCFYELSYSAAGCSEQCKYFCSVGYLLIKNLLRDFFTFSNIHQHPKRVAEIKTFSCFPQVSVHL